MSWRVVRKQSQQNDVFTVKKPGQGRSLQSVLADGRCTGHYKLQEKNLHEVPPHELCILLWTASKEVY